MSRFSCKQSLYRFCCNAFKGPFDDKGCNLILFRRDNQENICKIAKCNPFFFSIDNITVTCSVPLNLDTTKVVVPQIEEEEVPKQIIKIFTIDGKEVLDFNGSGVYIVVYDDYSRGRVGIIT